MISTTYTVTSKVLGTGTFGKVLLGYRNNNESYKVALKSLKKNKIGKNFEKLKSEIQILSMLDHPNICKYYETYESPKFVYLIMEYCGEGDLFEKITSD